MITKITLSQHRLTTFLTCRRRFQLRFLEQIPWPISPWSELEEATLDRGRRFHLLLERYFLGLPTADALMADTDLQGWWARFQGSGLELPSGRRLPEIGLTIPVGDHLLTGRFDLLIMGRDGERAYAQVFDWKTSKAQGESDLRQDWQTRLYLAILVEGGVVLREDGQPNSPDQVAITYWYVDEPDAPRTVRYDQAWHAQNWTEIVELIDQIDQCLGNSEWPLTDDWSNCRQCAYRSLCGRPGIQPAPRETAEEEFMARKAPQLEPDLP